MEPRKNITALSVFYAKFVLLSRDRVCTAPKLSNFGKNIVQLEITLKVDSSFKQYIFSQYVWSSFIFIASRALGV